MADIFQPGEYVPGYEKASDVEHTENEWVSPKLPGSDRGYVDDAIIIAMATKMCYDADGRAHGLGSCYVGPDSRWNGTNHCTHQDIVCDQFMCAVVALGALEKASTIKKPCPDANRVHYINGILATDLRRVIFKTDSGILAELMTRAGITWLRRNNWVTSYGEPLLALEVIGEISSLVDELKANGVDVRFWHVSEEENVEARQLLDKALLEPSCG